MKSKQHSDSLSHPTNNKDINAMITFLNTPESKRDVLNAFKKAQKVIKELNEMRRVDPALLNIPMTDFSLYRG